ncbi:MAG: hypothetical protein R2725_07210 [Solirubrobacterales bacterium]
MRPEKRGLGFRRLALAGLAVLAALLIGWLVGRSDAPPTSSSAPPLSAGGGEAVDFARSPRGAAAAVASFQRSFASPAILRPGGLQARIEAAATPGYVAEMLAANTPGTERIAAGAIGKGLLEGTRTIYAAVPIGYRVESFSQRRARVLTWGFTLLGNASSVEPAAYFGLTTTDLAWTDDGWRIAGTSGRFGPTPALGTQPEPLGSFDVVSLAAELESYEPAP